MQRERLTITLDTDLLAAVDTTIDHSRIRNRSHAIEHAIREGLALSDITTIVITGSVGDQLPAVISAVAQLAISEYIVISSQEALALSLQELTDAKVTRVPSDFGTGAALLLVQEKLTSAFLYINTDTLVTPFKPVPAYVFHRNNNGTVTHLIQSSTEGFSLMGVSIIEPDIIRHITSGPISLEAITFPNLAKAGRVMTYVSQ